MHSSQSNKCPKRRNFSAEEDLALLRQVLSERPFLAERGKTMAAWGKLAAQLVSDDNFSRDNQSGKNAQARFDKLMLQKRQQNAVSLAASGVEEEETEIDILLDELIALIDDHVDTVTADKEAAKRKRDAYDAASLTARRLAMESLQERGETPKKKKKEEDFKEFLLELKTMEHQEKKEAREHKAKVRAIEREEDRAVLLKLAEIFGKHFSKSQDY